MTSELVVTQMPRVFLYDIEKSNQPMKLSDPSDDLSPEAVLNFYAQTYPILVTAKVVGPEFRDDEAQYEFVSMIGTKG